MANNLQREKVRRAYGLTVQSLRNQIGMSQEKLALESGVDRAFMSGLECGKHTPTLLTLLRFLPYLKVSFAEFADEFDKCLRRTRREARKLD